MADAEDDSEFGSHFLDSMLEVEMTEEDGEVDISKNEDPLAPQNLPPIPTFDLQSETLSYKNVYSNSIVQPALTTLPIANEKVPMSVPIIKSGPMLALYPKEFLPTNAPTVSVKSNTVSVQKPQPKLLPRLTKPLIKNVNITEQMLAAQFLQRVFKAEYVKNVFVKKESISDISEVSKEENDFYNICFKDVTNVKYCRLHCTICDKHLGCGDNVAKKLKVHKMLKVLTCKACHDFYGDGNFPCDKGDNCEIYCRWCGQGGALVCCSFCPRVFCKKCVRRNYGPPFLKSIQKASDWACFCCAQKPLWPHRAICRALMEYMTQKKTDGKGVRKDQTTCCGISHLGRKKNMDKNKIIIPQGGLNINLAANPLKNKILPVKTYTGREQSLLKSTVPIKMNNQNKAINSVRLLNKNPKPNIFSRSLMSGNNIIRGITTSTPKKIYSPFSAPQLIQSPVLHGETLITPPKMLLTAKPPPKPAPPPAPSNSVRVSLTSQTPNLDLSKIPTAKIPHDVQGLILRMSFPDNKVQLVRLVTDGKGCTAGKEFPMPELKADSGFLEQNLSDSFKLSKIIFDRLMLIKQKVSSRTKVTEDTGLASAVKKLHFVYEKSAELFKELDQSLLEIFEQWKKDAKMPVDVIDLSDDDTARTTSERVKNKFERRSRFLDKCKELGLSDDSDIEILEDGEAKENSKLVGNSSANGNFKSRYRAGDGEGEGSPQGRRRKVGRKGRKRLRTEDEGGKGETEVGKTEEKTMENMRKSRRRSAMENGVKGGKE